MHLQAGRVEAKAHATGKEKLPFWKLQLTHALAYIVGKDCCCLLYPDAD